MADTSAASASTARKSKRKRTLILPRMLGREEAAAFCGVGGVSTWDRYSAAGMTPAPVRLGGAVLWCRAELAEWCRRGCPPRDQWAPVWRELLARRAK